MASNILLYRPVPTSPSLYPGLLHSMKDDELTPTQSGAEMVAELVAMGVSQASISALELRALVKLLVHLEVFSQAVWVEAQEAEFAAVLDFARQERVKEMLQIN